MSEPDHIIVKPIPNLAKGKITDIVPTGNSPVIIEKVNRLMPMVPSFYIFGIQCLYTPSFVFRLL